MILIKKSYYNILPNYIHLSKETVNLFNTSNFTVFNLFSVYEYLELFML